MNRGHLLQSSPVVQQLMAAGNPAGWWNINNMRAAPPQQPSQQPIPNPLIPHNSSQFINPTLPSWADHGQEMPESWSQLLLGGLVGEEEQKAGDMEAVKKMENWEKQVLLQQQQPPQSENSTNGYNLYENAEFHASAVGRSWSQMMPVSSPNSCVTTLSSNMLDFSSNKSSEVPGRNPVLPDPSPECNSTGNLGGGAAKKARVQPSSSTQSSFKFLQVRKEKLGDRITALHQLVSPFGKTDTASVLLEAIGYIRFLQSQIEALSLPYLATSKSGNNPRQHHHHVQGVERNCLFPEDPGQLVNENSMKRKAMSNQGCEEEEAKKDLRSRGLCLVPISCTLQVGSDNGADYWTPALGGGGGGFR